MHHRRSYPQVYVKASAFMRVSGTPYPAAELAPLLRELVTRFGAKRVLWGSDFPYALLGAPMPPGAAAAPTGADGLVPYGQVATALESWASGSATAAPAGAAAGAPGGGFEQEEAACVDGGGPARSLFSAEELRWIMGGTAASLFWK
jgi:hypothetical protein